MPANSQMIGRCSSSALFRLPLSLVWEWLRLPVAWPACAVQEPHTQEYDGSISGMLEQAYRRGDAKVEFEALVEGQPQKYQVCGCLCDACIPEVYRK